jgi:hypothetical protein
MDNEKEILQKVIIGGIIATMAATIRTLMVKGESPMQKVRTFVAGVCMGVMLAFILRNYGDGFWKEIIIACASAFISSIYPVLEQIVLKFIKKRGNEYISNNNDNKHSHGRRGN